MTEMVATDRTLSCVVIRGRAINIEQLFSIDIDSASLIGKQRTEFSNNKPFPHIVVDGLFNSELLGLIEQEFPEPTDSRWKNITGRHETTYRSKSAVDLGPA